MQDTESILRTFTTHVRQLIISFKELKKENGELKTVLDERNKEITELKNQLNEQQNQYNALMMAKMIDITDGDIEASRKRIQKLIRSVNKCIALLNGQEVQDDK